MIKLVKEQKKSQLKYQMVLCPIKMLFPIKDILETLPSSGINKYIKILQRQHSSKTMMKKLGKMEKCKTALRKVPPVLCV